MSIYNIIQLHYRMFHVTRKGHMNTSNLGILEAVKELKHMSLSEKMRARYDQGYAESRDESIRIFIKQSLKFGCSGAEIIRDIMDNYNMSEHDATQLWERYHGNH